MTTQTMGERSWKYIPELHVYDPVNMNSFAKTI